MPRSSSSVVVLSAFLPAALVHQALFAFRTAGDAASDLPFGLDIADLQRWVLIYLAVSSLAFVAVWVVGYLRRS